MCSLDVHEEHEPGRNAYTGTHISVSAMSAIHEDRVGQFVIWFDSSFLFYAVKCD